MDLEKAASAHLVASLLKHKPLANAANRLPEKYRTLPARPEVVEQDRAALHNVASNLYNQPGVRGVVEKAVGEICRELALDEPVGKKGKKGSREVVVDDVVENAVEGNTVGEQGEDWSGFSDAGEESQGDGDEEVDIDDEDDLNDGEGDSDDDEDDSDIGKRPIADLDSDDEREEEAILAKYDRLLGGSSDEDDDSNDDDESRSDKDDGDDHRINALKGHAALFQKRRQPRFTDDGISLSSRSPSPDPAPASKRARQTTTTTTTTTVTAMDLPPSQQPSKSKSKTSSKPENPTTGSTFLPTLMGGYISNSESDASDVDVAPVKKRLGQRQRQQIWMKKYGAGANHVIKQASEPAAKKQQPMNRGQRRADARGDGWDMRKGAVESGADARGRVPWKKDPAGAGTGANATDTGVRTIAGAAVSSTAMQAVHPSWAAKAKQKQMEVQARASATSGKPVKKVFDD